MSILGFAARRLLTSVPLLLGVMLVTFALLRGAGGSPFYPPEGFAVLPPPLQREVAEFYNLDEPWPIEFLTYVKQVGTLDFGPSLTYRDRSVDDVIRVDLAVTGELVLLATLWALPLGLALGIAAALRRGTRLDLLLTSTSAVLLVVPVFFVAYVLSEYVVQEWDLLPAGWDEWQSKILPPLALALAPMGYIARIVRAGVVETLGEEWVRTARSKGLRHRRVVVAHVLPASLVPFLAAAVPMLALLVTGAFFVEPAFGVPGASSEFVDAARRRDYPMVMGLTVALTVVVLLVNLVADVLTAAFDPRTRREAS
jgi:ABC-type dipeptide/oligopeptide/nickel transport system permease component